MMKYDEALPEAITVIQGKAYVGGLGLHNRKHKNRKGSVLLHKVTLKQTLIRLKTRCNTNLKNRLPEAVEL